MNNDPEPSLDPISFSEKLIEVLITHMKDKALPEEAMTSLIIRYDNGWIGGIFEDFEDDGTLGLTEMLRVNLKCAIIDRSYERPVSNKITPLEIRSFPQKAKNNLDYSQPATITEIGNVRVAFILDQIVKV